MSKKEQNSDKVVVKNQLLHEDPEKVLEAVKAAEEIGDESFVEPLVLAYRKWNEEEIQDNISKLFADLHDSKAMGLFVETLIKSPLAENDANLLSAIWQGKYELKANLAPILKRGFSAGYLCAFETLSIAENLQGEFEEEHLLEAQLTLKELQEKIEDQQIKTWISQSLVIVQNSVAPEE